MFRPYRPGGGGEALILGLLAPLRLTDRVVDAIEAGAEALEQIAPIREEIVRIRKHSQPLAELVPTVEEMRQELRARLDSLQAVVVELGRVESHVDDTVGGLVEELAAIHTTIRDLQADLERITDRLPDQNAPGPLERARDALTGAGG